MSPQMELSWTSIWQKTRVFCSLLFTVFLGVVLKKTRLYSGFWKYIKKIRETKKLVPIREKHCIERKKRVKSRTKTRVWEDSRLSTETSTKNAVQEFHLCTVMEAVKGMPYHLSCQRPCSCELLLTPAVWVIAFTLNHTLFKTTFEPGRRSSQPKPSLWSPNGSECETLRVKNYSK